MSGTLGNSVKLTARQLKLFLQIESLQSANQPVSAGLGRSLRSLTARNRRLLSSGERELAGLAPGTPQGRTFKQLVLRYLHTAVRPSNECLGDAAEAKTVKDVGAAATCFENSRRKGSALERAINNSMTQLGRTNRCTLSR